MRLETFRLLMALATKLGLIIHVVDVVGAYLNGTLQETIYMEQPPDYDDGTGRVSLLIKALYGLKQAGRTWNDELNQSFIGMEYTRLFSDQCVYIRHQKHDLTLAAVYTDDITILGSDIDAIKKAKAELGQHFTITDLGEAKQIIGLELQRNLKEGTLKLLYYFNQFVRGCDLCPAGRNFTTSQSTCDLGQARNFGQTSQPPLQCENFLDARRQIGRASCRERV